jgi:hypothetical protein
MPKRDTKPAESRTLQEIDGTASLPVKIVRGTLVVRDAVTASDVALAFCDADNATAVRAATPPLTAKEAARADRFRHPGALHADLRGRLTAKAALDMASPPVVPQLTSTPRPDLLPASASCVVSIAFRVTGTTSQSVGNAMLNHSKTGGSVAT